MTEEEWTRFGEFFRALWPKWSPETEAQKREWRDLLKPLEFELVEEAIYRYRRSDKWAMRNPNLAALNEWIQRVKAERFEAILMVDAQASAESRNREDPAAFQREQDAEILRDLKACHLEQVLAARASVVSSSMLVRIVERNPGNLTDDPERWSPLLRGFVHASLVQEGKIDAAGTVPSLDRPVGGAADG